MSTLKKMIEGEASEACATQSASELPALTGPPRAPAARALADAVIDPAAFDDSGPARSLQIRLDDSFKRARDLGKWSSRKTTAVLVLAGVTGWAVLIAGVWTIARLLG